MNREVMFRVWDKGQRLVDQPALLLHDGKTPDRKLGSQPPGTRFNKPHNWVWMQYTGLKDKNGVEIYEDDLWFYDGCQYLVQWTNLYAGFSLVANELNNKHTGEILQMFHAKKGEVIGNIYENPELLEAQS